MRTFLTLILSSFCGAASACTVGLPRDWVDEPIHVAEDGSFDAAGSDSGVNISGAPIVDLVDGRVGQRLFFTYCAEHQKLLFVDCSTRSAILIDGITDHRVLPVATGHHASTIDLIQIPLGPIDVREMASVDELTGIAEANGYHYQRELDEYVARMAPHNRFDPFNGCKIHYPNSAGAS